MNLSDFVLVWHAMYAALAIWCFDHCFLILHNLVVVLGYYGILERLWKQK